MAGEGSGEGAAPLPTPPGFRVERTIANGRHPLTEVFPGLDRLPPAKRLEPEAKKRATLFGETSVEIVPADLWMYVAPRRKIPRVPRRWRPIVTPGADCVVVGEKHLRESSDLMLWLDIYHELCHVRQRRDGADLYDRSVGYTDRWTEVEAYRFVVEEARRLKVPDPFLADYLHVEWISAEEHRRLLQELKVAPPAPAMD